jgi:outer membrane beta-barrel protein
LIVLHRTILSLILLAALCLDAPVAYAQETEAASDEVPIRVIQRRPILKSGRVELSALGGGGLADTMFNHVAVTGGIRYHLSETWSVASNYSHHYGQTSALFDEVTDRFELFPERSVIEWSTGIDVGWTPVYGKFALVDSYIMHFDLVVLTGAAAVVTSRSPDPKIAGVAGAAMHLYLSPWLALNADFRNHIFTESFNAGDTVVNHVVAQAGLSIFFPFEFAYRYPR